MMMSTERRRDIRLEEDTPMTTRWPTAPHGLLVASQPHTRLLVYLTCIAVGACGAESRRGAKQSRSGTVSRISSSSEPSRTVLHSETGTPCQPKPGPPDPGQGFVAGFNPCNGNLMHVLAGGVFIQNTQEDEYGPGIGDACPRCRTSFDIRLTLLVGGSGGPMRATVRWSDGRAQEFEETAPGSDTFKALAPFDYSRISPNPPGHGPGYELRSSGLLTYFVYPTSGQGLVADEVRDLRGELVLKIHRNAEARVQKVTDRLERSILEIVYAANNILPASIKDIDGNIVTLTPDSTDSTRIGTVAYPGGSSQVIKYDAAKRVERITVPLGLDAEGNPSRFEATAYVYGAVGQLQSVRDITDATPEGIETQRVEYTSLSTTIVSATESVTMSYQDGPGGRSIGEIRHSSGHKVTVDRKALSVDYTWPRSQDTASVSWNGSFTEVAVKDTAGKVRRQVRNVDGLPTRSTGTDNQSVSFGWNAYNELDSITDEATLNQVRILREDPRGRPTGILRPDGVPVATVAYQDNDATHSYTRTLTDAYGKTRSVTCTGLGPVVCEGVENGKPFSIVTTASGQVRSITFAGETTNFDEDLANRTYTVSGPGGETRISRDEVGRTEVRVTPPGGVGQVTHSFEPVAEPGGVRRTTHKRGNVEVGSSKRFTHPAPPEAP